MVSPGDRDELARDLEARGLPRTTSGLWSNLGGMAARAGLSEQAVERIVVP